MLNRILFALAIFFPSYMHAMESFVFIQQIGFKEDIIAAAQKEGNQEPAYIQNVMDALSIKIQNSFHRINPHELKNKAFFLIMENMFSAVFMAAKDTACQAVKEAIIGAAFNTININECVYSAFEAALCLIHREADVKTCQAAQGSAFYKATPKLKCTYYFLDNIKKNVFDEGQKAAFSAATNAAKEKTSAGDFFIIFQAAYDAAKSTKVKVSFDERDFQLGNNENYLAVSHLAKNQDGNYFIQLGKLSYRASEWAYLNHLLKNFESIFEGFFIGIMQSQLIKIGKNSFNNLEDIQKFYLTHLAKADINTMRFLAPWQIHLIPMNIINKNHKELFFRQWLILHPHYIQLILASDSNNGGIFHCLPNQLRCFIALLLILEWNSIASSFDHYQTNQENR